MSAPFSSRKMLTFFARNRINLQSGRVVIAVSGGMDSTVLAHAMKSLSDDLDLTLILGHVNHHLRPDCHLDEQGSRSLADELQLPLVVINLESPPGPGESIEAWARDKRYAALESIRLAQQADYILTGHHADDQMETVLMRLSQGAPPVMQAGIRPVRGYVLRPLLGFRRQSLEIWAGEHKLSWIDDSSNASRSYLRNVLRHDVLGKLIDEKVQSELLSIAAEGQRVEQRLSEQSGSILSQVEPGGIAGSYCLRNASLNGVEDGVFAMVVKSILRRYLNENGAISQPHWQSMRHFVGVASTGKVFDVTSGVRVLKDRGQLIFYRADTSNSAPAPRAIVPGKCNWGPHTILFEPHAGQGPSGFQIRTRKSGDRIAVRRGGRKHLLSDIFIDARLNLLEKEHWPVISDSCGVPIWLPGLVEPRNIFVTKAGTIKWQR